MDIEKKVGNGEIVAQNINDLEAEMNAAGVTNSTLKDALKALIGYKSFPQGSQLDFEKLVAKKAGDSPTWIVMAMNGDTILSMISIDQEKGGYAVNSSPHRLGDGTSVLDQFLSDPYFHQLR